MGMEDQFILKLPSHLKILINKEIEENGYPSLEIKHESKDIYNFIYKNNTYKANLVKLPTLLESHRKLGERQLCKVSDVSQMLIVDDKTINNSISDNNKINNSISDKNKIINNSISDNNKINNSINNKIDLYKNSGLTPPMKWCKLKRFYKNSFSFHEAEKIDKKIQELLEKELAAETTQIIFKEEEEEKQKIEVKEEIKKTVVKIKKEEIKEENKNNKILDEIKEIEEEIKAKEKLTENAPNIVIRKRFESAVLLLKEK